MLFSVVFSKHLHMRCGFRSGGRHMQISMIAQQHGFLGTCATRKPQNIVRLRLIGFAVVCRQDGKTTNAQLRFLGYSTRGTPSCNGVRCVVRRRLVHTCMRTTTGPLGKAQPSGDKRNNLVTNPRVGGSQCWPCSGLENLVT